MKSTKKRRKKTVLSGMGFLALLALLLFALPSCGQKSYFQSRDEAAEEDAAESEEKTQTEDDANTPAGEDAGSGSSGETENGEICYVHVGGAVANPGVYCLPSGSRVYQAIEMAGGLREDAFDRDLNQAALLTDGQKLYVYTKEEAASLPAAGAALSDDAENAAGGESGGKININTAGKEALMTLPGIGESKADAIIAYREENGGFSSAEEIKNISGIKDGVYAKIKDAICVN